MTYLCTLTDVYKQFILIHIMKNLKRKQFLLPQDILDEVKKTLQVKTDTEAVILSLQSVLRQKKLRQFKNLPHKIKFKLSHKELERMRRD